MTVPSGRDLRRSCVSETLMDPAGTVKIISEVSSKPLIRSTFTLFPSRVVATPEAPPMCRDDRERCALLWLTGVLETKAAAVPAAARRIAVCLIVNEQRSLFEWCQKRGQRTFVHP
mmetsp:Transcript_37257/g.111558  ORF Transcript_37257/g.111558 Transcript_37257/m.111558 type:complete len:116 (-) Transcript_37257:26-373(-)